MSRPMTRPASALAVALAAMALAACGSSSKSNSAAKAPATPSTATPSTTASSGYTAAFKRDFVGSCERNASASVCGCMFAYLKANVPFDKLAAGGANQRNPYIQPAVHACLAKKK